MIADPNLSVAVATATTINYIVKKIVSAVQPMKIILFGSQARGTQHSGSDVDLLVITKPGDDREQARLTIEKALRGRRFAIDLLVRTPADVEWNIQAENSFYTDDIMGEGQVLYEQ
jgi:predicted nucleotidyltransferase